MSWNGRYAALGDWYTPILLLRGLCPPQYCHKVLVTLHATSVWEEIYECVCIFIHIRIDECACRRQKPICRVVPKALPTSLFIFFFFLRQPLIEPVISQHLIKPASPRIQPSLPHLIQDYKCAPPRWAFYVVLGVKHTCIAVIWPAEPPPRLLSLLIPPPRPISPLETILFQALNLNPHLLPQPQAHSLSDNLQVFVDITE